MWKLVWFRRKRAPVALLSLPTDQLLLQEPCLDSQVAIAFFSHCCWFLGQVHGTTGDPGASLGVFLWVKWVPAILWMDEILHQLRRELRGPRGMIPLPIPTNGGFLHGFQVVRADLVHPRRHSRREIFPGRGFLGAQYGSLGERLRSEPQKLDLWHPKNQRKVEWFGEVGQNGDLQFWSSVQSLGKTRACIFFLFFFDVMGSFGATPRQVTLVLEVWIGRGSMGDPSSTAKPSIPTTWIAKLRSLFSVTVAIGLWGFSAWQKAIATGDPGTWKDADSGCKAPRGQACPRQVSGANFRCRSGAWPLESCWHRVPLLVVLLEQ